MINRKTYKGIGRPRKQDYLPSFFEKWGNTILLFGVFCSGIVFWFGGAVRIHKTYAEPKPPLRQAVINTPIQEPKTVVEVRPTVESYFHKYDDWNPEIMIAICRSEVGWIYQGWKEDAQYRGNGDGSTDTGVCMINSIHGFDEELLKNAEYNIEKAHAIWKYSGYDAWSDYKNGRYLKYIN